MQKNCKKVAKKLQKNCKNFAKCAKKIFLLCKIFANFLQILNLHTDFRPREESVRMWVHINFLFSGFHQLTFFYECCKMHLNQLCCKLQNSELEYENFPCALFLKYREPTAKHIFVDGRAGLVLQTTS